MQFHMRAQLRLSGDATRAVDEVANLLKNAEEGLLQRGAPPGEGAHIKDWRIHDNSLELEIEGTRHVRAHDALLRLRKPLQQLLGPKYRIGVRGIDVEQYTIEVPSEQPLKALKIPYVRELEYHDGSIHLELEVGEREIEGRVPDRIITLLEDKIQAQQYGGKAEHWELLWASPKKPMKFTRDPTEAMMEQGWIKRGGSRGQWIYGPQITRIFRVFEEIVEEKILGPLGYSEMIFPKLVTWDIWKRSGHAKGIYPEMYYVSPPKTRDPEFWEEVIDYYKVTQEIPLHLLREKMGDPIGGMCYAQCPPFWNFLLGETIADDCFPIKVYDRSGTSHRYESGGIHGIERVDEFHRIELVWLGTPEQVKAHAEELKEVYRHIFEDILDLQWRMAWVTPWFMAQEGMTGTTGRADVGTIDYEAMLPYRGEDAEWLEFQNQSIAGEKYPKGFNVKSQSGEELWSGCSGIGLERWASAFLAQNGLDPQDWPEEMRRRVGELPGVFRFL